MDEWVTWLGRLIVKLLALCNVPKWFHAKCGITLSWVNETRAGVWDRFIPPRHEAACDWSLGGLCTLFCITNNRQGVTITRSKRYFLIGMTTVRPPTNVAVFLLQDTLLLVNETKQLSKTWLRETDTRDSWGENDSIVLFHIRRRYWGNDLSHEGVVDCHNVGQPAFFSPGRKYETFWIPSLNPTTKSQQHWI